MITSPHVTSYACVPQRSARATAFVRTVCVGAAASITACSSLPSAGPTTDQIADQAGAPGASFNLVEVDGRVASVAGTRQPDGMLERFARTEHPTAPRIGVGDTVAVSIWQAATSGALLGPATGGEAGAVPGGGGTQTMILPPQVVAADGAISVPFAGRVRAAGRTPSQVQQSIERLLANRLIEPQAVVTLAGSLSEAVTVSGESNGTVRVPLSVRGDRLLDVIAAAGGTKSPLYETTVRLSRDGNVASVPLDDLAVDARQNIYARPGDVISLIRAPQTFSVFGATFNNAEVPFNAASLNLAQAIARAGGLLDARADPAGVFLFRYETRPVVAELAVEPKSAETDGRLPVVYHVDLQDAGGYFLAKRFAVENGDIIYVANAASDRLQKFFTLVSTLTGPIIGGVVVTRGSN